MGGNCFCEQGQCYFERASQNIPEEELAARPKEIPYDQRHKIYDIEITVTIKVRADVPNTRPDSDLYAVPLGMVFENTAPPKLDLEPGTLRLEFDPVTNFVEQALYEDTIKILRYDTEVEPHSAKIKEVRPTVASST